uniref:Uncharacterized protein n=1 Tax=Cannabis sativa TaxID=3483 RepID=A0A803PKX5_CANSA
MSIFTIPSKITAAIDKNCWDFLWGTNGNRIKLHRASWEKVCLPKNLGGISFREGKKWNKALLAKFFWAHTSKHDFLWVKWINSVYLKEHDIWDYPMKMDDGWGKEEISDKSMPFQYPHPPAMTLLDIPPVDLNIPARGSLGSTIRFPSFLTHHVTSGFQFTPSQQFAAIMIPTLVNPNLGGMLSSFSRSGLGLSSNNSAFTSYSTDSVLVVATAHMVCSKSSMEGFTSQVPVPATNGGSLALGSHTMELEAGVNVGQPDQSVRGKEVVNYILDCLGPPLEDSEVDFLNQPFTFDEVQQAVFQLSGNKAPGLDGLNAYFYQKN